MTLIQSVLIALMDFILMDNDHALLREKYFCSFKKWHNLCRVEAVPVETVMLKISTKN